MKLTEANVSRIAVGVLKNAGYHTVEQVLAADPNEIAKMRGVGQKTLDRLALLLARREAGIMPEVSAKSTPVADDIQTPPPPFMPMWWPEQFASQICMLLVEHQKKTGPEVVKLAWEMTEEFKRLMDRFNAGAPVVEPPPPPRIIVGPTADSSAFKLPPRRPLNTTPEAYKQMGKSAPATFGPDWEDNEEDFSDEPG